MLIEYNQKRIYAFSDTTNTHRRMSIHNNVGMQISAGDVITLKKLMCKYDFQDFEEEFITLWKVNCNFQRLMSVKQYNILYDGLRLKEELSSQYYIRLVSRWERAEPNIDINCAVYDEDGCLQGPMARHLVLAEVLAMPIYIDDNVELTEKELLAGLFWELTYFTPL